MAWARGKVKAATVEGRLGRRRPRFWWLDGVERALYIKGVGLERKDCVEKNCEGVIVLTQSDEGKDLRVIDSLF